MRWRSSRRSRNVEDRREFRVSRRVAGGGIGTIVIVLIALCFGVDTSVIINQSIQQGGEMVSTTQPYSGSATENQLSGLDGFGKNLRKATLTSATPFQPIDSNII
ncbi:MAG: neutral zinc metallopeptidase [Desulfobacterales bacterium]